MKKPKEQQTKSGNAIKNPINCMDIYFSPLLYFMNVFSSSDMIVKEKVRGEE